eukprot:5003142-Ditylum_brightwellii.AAC.1
MKGSANPLIARRYISAVEGPSLVRLCLRETRIFMQLSMRKSPRLLATKKRRSSTSLRLYPSCPIAIRTKTATTTPGSATPLMKSLIWSENVAMGKPGKKEK